MQLEWSPSLEALSQDGHIYIFNMGIFTFLIWVAHGINFIFSHLHLSCPLSFLADTLPLGQTHQMWAPSRERDGDARKNQDSRPCRDSPGLWQISLNWGCQNLGLGLSLNDREIFYKAWITFLRFKWLHKLAIIWISDFGLFFPVVRMKKKDLNEVRKNSVFTLRMFWNRMLSICLKLL